MSASSLLSTIAPQFDDTTGRSDFIAIAQSQVGCIFGDKADLATAYLSAHFIALFTDSLRQKGESGSITSKREGDLALGFGNFASGAGSDAGLSMTTYGQQYIILRDSTMPNLHVIGYGGLCE